VFREYWKLPGKTADDFTADGFFRTGDNGLVDDAGYVSIVGRKKDMIISGGLNVYPIEIELVINEMPGVDEAAVIGVPHPEFGEAVVAVVVLKDKGQGQESELIAQLKSRVANFKVPKRVFYLDDLPRNTMGKVQKSLLRERYQDLFH